MEEIASKSKDPKWGKYSWLDSKQRLSFSFKWFCAWFDHFREYWVILKHFSSSWGRLISICYFLFLLRAITWIIHFYRCLLYLAIMCKILLSYIFSFFNILFSQQSLLAHQLSHLPCWLPHSLWLGRWCQGQQHLNHLGLPRNAVSGSPRPLDSASHLNKISQ